MPRRTYAQRLVQALATRCPGVWADVDGSVLWLSLPNTATARTTLPDDRRAAVTDQVVDELLARAATWLRAERAKYNPRSKANADVLLWILDHPRDPEPRATFTATSTQPLDLTGPALHLGQVAHDDHGRAQLTLDEAPLNVAGRLTTPALIGPDYHQAWQWGYRHISDEGHTWLMQQWRAHAAPCDLATEQAALVLLMRGSAHQRAIGEPDFYLKTINDVLATFPDKDKPRLLNR